MIMYNFKLKLMKSIFHVRNRINFLFFIISIISIILLLLKLINLDIILQLDTNLLFNGLFQFLWMASSIFIILFLPSYPFFFKIYKSVRINALEKIGLTIVFNMSFYIVIGYFGNGLGFNIDANYFFMQTLHLLLRRIFCFPAFRTVRRFIAEQNNESESHMNEPLYKS